MESKKVGFHGRGIVESCLCIKSAFVLGFFAETERSALDRVCSL